MKPCMHAPPASTHPARAAGSQQTPRGSAAAAPPATPARRLRGWPRCRQPRCLPRRKPCARRQSPRGAPWARAQSPAGWSMRRGCRTVSRMQQQQQQQKRWQEHCANREMQRLCTGHCGVTNTAALACQTICPPPRSVVIMFWPAPPKLAYDSVQLGGLGRAALQMLMPRKVGGPSASMASRTALCPPSQPTRSWAATWRTPSGVSNSATTPPSGPSVYPRNRWWVCRTPSGSAAASSRCRQPGGRGSSRVRGERRAVGQLAQSTPLTLSYPPAGHATAGR